LTSVAEKHNKSVAQVILRWLTQRGVVVIPKSVSKQRIDENINIFDFELATQDIDAISQLDTKKSTIFDHHDPASVKFLGNYRFDI
jgi:2,5-diketo-D-gluconate reductase A